MAFHFTSLDIEVMRRRWRNGPFLKQGDAYIDSLGKVTTDTSGKPFINSPKVIPWGKTWAEEFAQGNITSYIMTRPKGAGNDPHQSYSGFGYIPQHCALRYLMEGNSNDAQKVKDYCMAQIAITDMDCSLWPYYNANTNPTNVFHHANWLIRFLYTYDYVKDIFSVIEKGNMDAFFLRSARYMDDNAHEVLIANFPNRRNRDYKPANGSAADTGDYTKGEYTHYDANGNPGTQIHWIHKQYNNRVTSQFSAAGLIGVYLGDDDLTNHARMYYEEWLKYSVFPDGTNGEYNRNYQNAYESNNPTQGTLYYNAINIDAMMFFADALRRKGDNSMYEYTTSVGLFSSEGGEKNLILVINRNCSIINQEVDWYSISSRNPGTHLDQFDNNANVNKHTVHDCSFVLANIYYKSKYIADTIHRHAIPDIKLSGHDSQAETYPEKSFKSSGGWWWGLGSATAPVLSPMLSWDNYSIESPVEPPIEPRKYKMEGIVTLTPIDGKGNMVNVKF
jgi:hypothetical protein